MATIKGSAITIDDDEVGIFGFGSLLSVQSLEKTLGRSYQNATATVTISGWRRRWNITEPNTQEYNNAIYAVGPTGRFSPDRILYLNIERVENQLLNGLLFFIRKEELDRLDHRESVYNRIKITDQINEYDIHGGTVYTYEGMKRHVDNQIDSPRKAAIQQSYLDTIEEALGYLGNAFRERYESSTDPVPSRLVIRDRWKK